MARSGSALAALALSALAITIAACGGDDDGDVSTFEHDGFPFTFQHPADFEQSENVTIDEELGGTVSGETLAVALNDDNGIILQSNTLNFEVDAGNLSRAKAEFDLLTGQVDPAAEGEEGELAGFPSLTYDAIELTTPEEGQSRFTFLFNGGQQYVINCQSTPDDRAKIEAACDQALDTLRPTEDAG